MSQFWTVCLGAQAPWADYLVPPLVVFLSVIFLGQRLDWNASGALNLLLTGAVASEGRWRCSRHRGMRPQR